MIAFLRRFRYKLITNRKVRQYILYAFGEIILVMIGILLAVQVNDWSTLRKEQKEEQQLLRQLKTEFEVNRMQIEDKITLHGQIVNSGKQVLRLVDGQDRTLSLDSLYSHLGWTITAPTFDPSLGVTNDLINSGKLYLIRNDSLRHLVSGWSGYIDFATEEEKIWLKIRDEFYIPYLKESFSYRNVLHAIQQEGHARAIMNFGGKYELSNAGRSKLANAEFREFTEVELMALEDQIAELTNLNDLSVTQMTVLRDMADQILGLIEEDIN